MMGTQHVYDVTAAIKVPGPVAHEVSAASAAPVSASASAAPSGEASQKVMWNVNISHEITFKKQFFYNIYVLDTR